MKKAYSVLLCVLLCFALQIGVFAADMELRTVVPGQHEITVTYNEGGYVLYEDEVVPSGTTIIVPRHGAITLEIICGADCHIETVTVNDEDVTDQLVHGELPLQNVYTDLNIVFGFADCNPGIPNPDEHDPCHRFALQGGVYSGDRDTPLPNASMIFDFGEIETVSDRDGQYSIPVIKDGRHRVEIKNSEGVIVGIESFVIEVRADAAEITVETLEDGTQVVVVPEETELADLDFIVNPDGSVTILPGIPAPSADEPPSIGEIIKDNPVIIQTGALIRENPTEAAVLFGFAFFLLLFLLFARRRKRDDEEEENRA